MSRERNHRVPRAPGGEIEGTRPDVLAAGLGEDRHGSAELAAAGRTLGGVQSPGCCQTTTAVPSGVNATRGFVVPGSPDVMSSSSVNKPPAGRTKALSVPSRMETTIAFRSESTATSASWALEQKVGGL